MTSATDQLDRTFGALADPTRRAILARLAAGPATVTELAGLIARGRERQWRPARLEAGPLKEVAEWTQAYRRFWEESYDRLDEYLEEIQGRGKEKDDGR